MEDVAKDLKTWLNRIKQKNKSKYPKVVIVITGNQVQYMHFLKSHELSIETRFIYAVEASKFVGIRNPIVYLTGEYWTNNLYKSIRLRSLFDSEEIQESLTFLLP